MSVLGSSVSSMSDAVAPSEEMPHWRQRPAPVISSVGHEQSLRAESGFVLYGCHAVGMREVSFVTCLLLDENHADILFARASWDIIANISLQIGTFNCRSASVV